MPVFFWMRFRCAVPWKLYRKYYLLMSYEEERKSLYAVLKAVEEMMTKEKPRGNLVAVERVAQAAEEARRAITAGGILSAWSRACLGVIARTTTPDMVDGTLLHLSLAGGLAFELFVEGEDGFLTGGVDVACSSSARREFGGSLWETVLEERGWATGGGSWRGLGGFEGVTSATTAGVDEFAGGWVGLSDGVAGWHVGYLFGLWGRWCCDFVGWSFFLWYVDQRRDDKPKLQSTKLCMILWGTKLVEWRGCKARR